VSFLVDTDICSAHLKESGRVTSRFLQYTGRLHVSVVTVAELFSWVSRANASPRRLHGLLAFLSDVTVLDINVEIARKFGEIQARFLDQGQSMPGMDLLIASTALVYDLTVVTHNTRDFSRVAGLAWTDWLSP
jgi:tRNA(fMet)-specific endonuclease VapC